MKLRICKCEWVSTRTPWCELSMLETHFVQWRDRPEKVHESTLEFAPATSAAAPRPWTRYATPIWILNPQSIYLIRNCLLILARIILNFADLQWIEVKIPLGCFISTAQVQPQHSIISCLGYQISTSARDNSSYPNIPKALNFGHNPIIHIFWMAKRGWPPATVP